MVKTLVTSAVIAGLLMVALCSAATADDAWATWWGDRGPNVTYLWDNWGNLSGTNPYTVLPDSVTPPGSIGDAIVAVQTGGASLIAGPMTGYGPKTWFWDLGPNGGMDVSVASHPQGMLVWVQVTYFDMGTFSDGNHNVPTVNVAGADQIAMGIGQYDVHKSQWTDPLNGNQWLTYASLWKLDPGVTFGGIDITTGVNGAIIDQVVVDTRVLPEPGAVMLALLGSSALFTLRRYRRK